MGKVIRVTPEELDNASTKLSELSDNYTTIYQKLMQTATTMGEAWEGADNQAFVSQISGFCDDLKQMADKLKNASQALKKQSDNYTQRQQSNITSVKKLAN